MYDLQIFDHQDFGQLRTLEVDGEIWFVAVDVCKALDHSNPTMALDRLDDDERAKFNLGYPKYEINCVNEPGLYSLVLGSRKPEAKSFKRWITHEVIPALRRTGTYSLTMNTPPLRSRELTVDDYLKAAQIVANCRNERMPYVMSFLRQAGLEMPGEELAKLEERRPGIMLTKEEKAAIIDEAVSLLRSSPYTLNETATRLGFNNANMLSYYRSGARRPSVERAKYIIDTLKNGTEVTA